LEAEHIDDFRGLNDRSPWLAFLMLLVMMSMAGIPFLVGFYAKLVVLQAIISEGFIGLAILAVVFSVIGAFYYLRVVKCLYFDPPASDQPLTLSRDTQVVLSANGLLLVALGLYPTALLTWCATAF
jgi:NADH-quinone oxidoreductase subunit N